MMFIIIAFFVLWVVALLDIAVRLDFVALPGKKKPKAIAQGSKDDPLVQYLKPEDRELLGLAEPKVEHTYRAEIHTGRIWSHHIRYFRDDILVAKMSGRDTFWNYREEGKIFKNGPLADFTFTFHEEQCRGVNLEQANKIALGILTEMKKWDRNPEEHPNSAIKVIKL